MRSTTHPLQGKAALLATTAALAAFALPAAAQDAQGARLEEVVVTAQKRAERLEDVPISITAISGEGLEKAGIKNLQDIGQVSVGVQISHTATFIQPTIRGVTATLSFGTLGNNTAVYADGFYTPTPLGLNTDLINISNVQVLKGPQGTLFGRNTTGGAILIETLTPRLDDMSGRLVLKYGRFDERVGQVYVTGPIVPGTLGFDLAAYKRTSDGYIKNVGGAYRGPAAPINIETLRGKLLWKPTEDLKATLLLSWDDVSDPSNSVRQYYDRQLIKLEVPSAIQATNDFEASTNFQTLTRAVHAMVGVTVEYDLGWAQLKSLTQAANERSTIMQDNDASTAQRIKADNYASWKYVTQEFNLGASTERYDWVLGAFYMKYTGATNSRNYAALNTTTLVEPAWLFSPGPNSFGKTRLQTWAAFADGTYRITDKLALIGGLRYSWDQPQATLPLATALAVGITNPQLRTKFTAWTPRAVVRYEVAPDTNVYLSYSKGFKSGGYGSGVGVPRNELNQAGNYPLRPEKSTAYELGFKTAQRTWRLSAAAFLNNYIDQQISSVFNIVNPVNGVLSPTQVPVNAASSRIKGIEVEGVWSPTDDLNLRAGVGWLHARYRRFPNALSSGICPSTAPGASCTDAGVTPSKAIPAGYNTSNQIAVDLSGMQMLRAPDWSVNAGFDYTVRANAGDVTITGSASYRSSYPENDFSLVPGQRKYRFLIRGYTLVNGQVAWTPYNGPVTLSVWGNNLLDKTVYMYYVANVLGDGRGWAPPRTYGVSLDYKF